MSRYVIDSFQDKNMYMASIRLMDRDGLPFECPRGSYNLLQARLFNMSYVEYLRFIRTTYGATLKGRESTYISVYFNDKNKNGAKELCKELNKRLEKAISARKELYE